MRGNDAVVSASERTGPGGARAEAFEIVENLACERKKCANRVAALYAKRHHRHGRSFNNGEDVSGSHGCGGMIGSFAGNRHLENVPTQRARQLTCEAERGGITFDGENTALQGRNADSGKCLQRMHRADGRTESAQGFKN